MKVFLFMLFGLLALISCCYITIGLIMLLINRLFKRNSKYFSGKKVGLAFVLVILFAFGMNSNDPYEDSVDDAKPKTEQVNKKGKKSSAKSKDDAKAKSIASSKAKSASLAKSSSIAKAKRESLARAKSVSIAKAKSSSKAKSISIAKSKAKPGLTIRLVRFTNAKSAGLNKNYYFLNGTAKTTAFNLKAGGYKFRSDALGRSARAEANLTYNQWLNSRGGRQGTPLDPPALPSYNPRTAINFSLTGRVYHGYLYNRSHSIADSLLGTASYSSPYNFTTGTRAQNVGANQKGGMRYAESLVEDFWASHPNTGVKVSYVTTPVYYNSETMPRGSKVDIKSSDGSINTEVVVINSAEGVKLNYNSGESTAVSAPSTSYQATTAPKVSNNVGVNVGGWSTAKAGYVYVKISSGIYYTSVKNAGNYSYMSKSEADASGYRTALRGNAYAKP